MTEQERAEWEERLRAAVAETLRRRAARRRIREEHQAARDAGLRQRHAARLARARTTPGDAMPDRDQAAKQPPCCRDSGHPDGCAQHVQALAVLDPRRARRRRRIDPGAPTPAPDGPEAA